MQEENLKLEDLLTKSSIPSESEALTKVAIIGAGVMGQGIAQTIAASGMDVLIVEEDEKSLERAKTSLSEFIDNEIKRWAMTNSDKKAIFGRITWETDFKHLKEYSLIIEAVREDFNLKLKIFKEIDEIANDKCILISNTSTLSLTKLAEATKRPEKVIGLHFLTPVPKVPVVEVVKCLQLRR
jgi:3-hydroxybutyryl-CoA dehydrogenase